MPVPAVLVVVAALTVLAAPASGLAQVPPAASVAVTDRDGANAILSDTLLVLSDAALTAILAAFARNPEDAGLAAAARARLTSLADDVADLGRRVDGLGAASDRLAGVTGIDHDAVAAFVREIHRQARVQLRIWAAQVSALERGDRSTHAALVAEELGLLAVALRAENAVVRMEQVRMDRGGPVFAVTDAAAATNTSLVVLLQALQGAVRSDPKSAIGDAFRALGTAIGRADEAASRALAVVDASCPVPGAEALLASVCAELRAAAANEAAIAADLSAMAALAEPMVAGALEGGERDALDGIRTDLVDKLAQRRVLFVELHRTARAASSRRAEGWATD